VRKAKKPISKTRTILPFRHRAFTIQDMPSKPGGCCKSQGGKRQHAIMVDGQRYTCEKCRKGHRTGTCTHLVDDNGQPSLLQKTNRAGRPNTTSKCRCPSSDRCTCVKTWYLVVRIPKSEIEPGKEGETNCRIVGTVVKPLREDGKDNNDGGTLIASSEASSGHQCTCGDTCACTYCPEHPDNQATHDHNQYLADQNRPRDSTPRPEQQLVESSSQGCGGTAEISYACSSDDSAAGKEAMLSTIPLNDQNYHYQVYSGQYSRGGCGIGCRCPGCITWRVAPIVKQQLVMTGYGHEDCPPKCNCTGCWSYRERGGSPGFPILSLEEFFTPVQDKSLCFGSISPQITSPGHIDTYNGSLVPKNLLSAYQAFHPENLLVPVQPQLPDMSPAQSSYDPFFHLYSDSTISSAHHSRHLSVDDPPNEFIPLDVHSSSTFTSQSIMEAYQ
jgi:Copper fist DNA binding domain